MFDNYNPNEYNPKSGFELPPPGRYKAYVEEAEHTYSKAGNKMIKMVFSLDGYGTKVYHYILDNDYAQRNLDQFYNSFAIKPGNFDLSSWTGKSGEVQIKHEESNGYANARIHYFHLRKGQDTASAPASAPRTYSDADENAASEEDFPFPLDFSEMSDANEDVQFPGEFAF